MNEQSIPDRMTRPADIAVVVLSCDRYRDLWTPFFELFFRNWEACKYPVYLFANEASYPDMRVTTVLSGEDRTWSDSIKRCLQQLSHQYVWLIFDDVFFDRPVDEEKIQRLEEFISSHTPDYLRFRKYPRPDVRINQHFGLCRKGVSYRTSIFAIWKRTTLIELIDPTENAWEFEYNSVKRSEIYSDFYGVYEEYFSYIHGIEKGIWTQDAVRNLRKLLIEPDLASRPQMTDAQHAAHRKAQFRTRIFNNTPSTLKPLLLQGSKFVRHCLKKIG